MEPRPCKQCGVKFTPSQNGRPYCSRPCYWESKRGKTRKGGVNYRMTTKPGHPLAPPSGVLPVARIVLYEKLGPGKHPCHWEWCGHRILKWKPKSSRYAPDALYVDHLNHDTADDSPDNLVPSCNACNGHRRKNGGSPPIREGELSIMWGNARTRAVKLYCNQCGAEFLTIPAELKRRGNRGRYCSGSCARSALRQSD